MAGDSADTRSRRTRVSRRRTIRTVGAGSTALLGLSAGCTDALPIGSDDGEPRVRLPDPEPPTYRDWLPAPDEVAIPGFDQVPMEYPLVFTPSQNGSEQLGRPLGFAQRMLGSVGYFGVGIEQYDLAIWDGRSAALAGPVDLEAVTSTVLDSGYERAGTHRQYECFDRSDVPRTVAVTEGRLAWAKGSSHRELVEALVDAREGHIQRRHEASDAYAALTARAGLRPYVLPFDRASQLLPDRSVAGAEGIDVDDDAGYRFQIARLPPDQDVSRDEITDRINEHFFDEAPIQQTIDVEDRFVTVAQRLTHDETWPPYEVTPPQITWGVRDRPDGLAITHEAGEPIESSRLSILDPDGEPIEAGIPPNRTLTAGDVVELDPTVLQVSEFGLLWNSPDARSSILLEYSVN